MNFKRGDLVRNLGTGRLAIVDDPGVREVPGCFWFIAVVVIEGGASGDRQVSSECTYKLVEGR